MRYLSLEEVLEVHRIAIAMSGGAPGIHDLGVLESAVAQPYMTFDGEELYPTMAEKAAALAFSLVQGHPFVDGNKRVAHAAMETFLVINAFELDASTDEQEAVMLQVAASQMKRPEFVEWVQSHLVEHLEA